MQGRRLFASILATALLTLGVVVAGQAQGARPAKRAIEGTWRETVNLGPNRPPGIPEIIELLITFDDGGGYVSSDDSTTNGHGAWEYGGHGVFNLTSERFIFNPDGSLFALLHVRAKLTLDASQDNFTTEEVVQFRLYPTGDVLNEYSGAAAVGHRLVVEPIE